MSTTSHGLMVYCAAALSVLTNVKMLIRKNVLSSILCGLYTVHYVDGRTKLLKICRNLKSMLGINLQKIEKDGAF